MSKEILCGIHDLLLTSIDVVSSRAHKTHLRRISSGYYALRPTGAVRCGVRDGGSFALHGNNAFGGHGTLCGGARGSVRGRRDDPSRGEQSKSIHQLFSCSRNLSGRLAIHRTHRRISVLFDVPKKPTVLRSPNAKHLFGVLY